MGLIYTKETQLQNDCLKYLKAKRVFHWRQNSGAKGVYKFTSINGLPDIIAIINGKFIGFELKIKNNKVSKDQIQTHRAIKKAGGMVYVIRDLNELKMALEEVESGNSL